MITIVDVIKLGYKQDKDGFVISFRLHPNDDHDEIARALLGSQWQMKLVPLDDDGNPQDTGELDPPAPSPVREARADGGRQSTASRSSHNVAPGKRLVQQAALCCKDPLFQRFLQENYDHTIAAVEDAAAFVREHCEVYSRSEIQIGTKSADLWDQLFGKYLVWRKAPELQRS